MPTVVLPKISHCNSSKSVPNRPLRGRRGRFGTLLQQLECGIFGRTAVGWDVIRYKTLTSSCGQVRAIWVYGRRCREVLGADLAF